MPRQRPARGVRPKAPRRLRKPAGGRRGGEPLEAENERPPLVERVTDGPDEKDQAGKGRQIRIRDPLRCLEPTPSSDCTFRSATLTTELSMDPGVDVGSTRRRSRSAG
jgi:hypothetical protein